MGRQAEASGPTRLLQSNNRCLSCFTEGGGGGGGGGGWKEGECGKLGPMWMNGSDNKCPQSWVDVVEFYIQ